MNEQFVIVAKVGTGHFKNTQFYYHDTERDTINGVMTLSTRGGLEEQAEVERVFKFNEYGNVTKYEMVLSGFKPKLREIPALRG